jgi:hypothetical protein
LHPLKSKEPWLRLAARAKKVRCFAAIREFSRSWQG